MRIVEIREKTVSIASAITNAYIDFSKMTCSVVALITDVVRDGKPVVGYGFNSNGRYGEGALMRERFFPRLMAADPKTLVDESGGNLDPFRIWTTLMKNEKPGGHGERSVAVGAIDMAVWDAVAKIAGRPLYRLLADRYRGGQADDKVWIYAAGGYYYPGKDLTALKSEMKRYRDLGYQVVKMKIGGAPLDEDIRRIEAVLEVVGDGKFLAVDANGRFDLDTAIAYGEAMKPYGWSTRRVVPHGGHQMSLNIAAGLHLGGNESYPGVFQPFGGFADGIAVENGYVGLPKVPGVGFETKAELFKVMKSLSD